MAEINKFNKKPLQGAYVATTQYNRDLNNIKSKIDDYVNTSFLARIDKVHTQGVEGATYVNATMLSAQIDANGNAVDMAQLQELPHYRIQSGIAGIVLNPVVGDIGVFSCNKTDSSNIDVNTKEPKVPSSFRRYNPSDACMVATVHTKAPTNYIELKQDNTILIHCPNGLKIETDCDVEIECNNLKANCKSSAEITAPTITLNGDVTINGTLKTSGQITSQSDVVASGVSLDNHVHGGVMGGSATTSKPQ